MKTNFINKSKELFDSGFCCAESVLIVTAEYKNIQSDLIPRVASGLCGGIGKTDSVCGAVSGSVLAIGTIYGRDDADEPREEIDAKVQKFIHEFKKIYGTTQCTQLIDCDLSTEEGRQQFKDLNIHPKCKDIVGEATKIVMSLI